MLGSRIVKTLTVCALLAVTPALIPSTASAAPTANTFQIPMVWNAHIWMCSAVHTYCSAYPRAITGETPGVVSFPPPTHWWDAPYWVHWTNISTLQSGTAALNGGTPDVRTGTGLVAMSMTNGHEVLAGSGAFWVP